MKTPAIVLLTTALLMTNVAEAATHQLGDSAAAARISQALAASNIEAPGSPPFRMEARIQVHLGPGQTENGKLVWIWTPVGWWHEELSLSGYQSVGVSDGRQVWMTSTMDYLPFPVFLTEQALNVLDRLRQERGKPLKERETSSPTGETCIESTSASSPLRYCMDAYKGILRRVVDDAWNMTFRYSDYEPFGDKSFPRLIEVAPSDESDFVEIRVVQLAAVDQPDLRMFLPVKGAKTVATAARCKTIEPAKLKKMVRPEYPREAQNAGISGVVKLYAEVGSDGVPRGMWPLNSAPPILTQAAIDAVKRWRYRPRACKGDRTRLPQVETITLLFRSP